MQRRLISVSNLIDGFVTHTTSQQGRFISLKTKLREKLCGNVERSSPSVARPFNQLKMKMKMINENLKKKKSPWQPKRELNGSGYCGSMTVQHWMNISNWTNTFNLISTTTGQQKRRFIRHRRPLNALKRSTRPASLTNQRGLSSSTD